MHLILLFFTIATYLTLFLQFARAKSGTWHRRRAILIGVLPIPPIGWNIIALAKAETFFSGWNMIHMSFGIIFYYFWLRTIRMGVYATERATSIKAHEQSARLTLVSGILVFLVPFLLHWFDS